MPQIDKPPKESVQLYTPEQRVLRDQTLWTPIQGVLAIFQFLVFCVSLVLVLRCLITGEGADWAQGSIILKTLTLYAIMVSGSLWEKVVFGQYLFAKPFFWEDVVSMGVIALHTLYIASLFFTFLTLEQQMFLILSAYAAYAINAGQFVLKLRAARRQDARLACAPPPNAPHLRNLPDLHTVPNIPSPTSQHERTQRPDSRGWPA
jgi:3-vinyl bacteriochlorophyllide hydratase